MPAIAFLVFWLVALVAAAIAIVLSWRFAKVLLSDFWRGGVPGAARARRRRPPLLGGWPRRHGLIILALLLGVLAVLLVSMRLVARMGGL